MDANLKRGKPADMLRVEAAYCGDEIVGLRITADDPARQLLVWADNSVMNGFRIGNEFIAGWDKKIEYRDVAIGEPEPAAPAAAITPKPDEWDVRGHLAASLTFWHRLKGEDADELVAALQSWATRAQPAAQGHPWGCRANAFGACSCGQAPDAGAWIERWYGSGGKDGYEGWSIVSKEGRGLVAYLGRDVESGAVTEIVMAHNATLASTTAQAAPAEGDWIDADDVDTLARQLDAALNGEAGAAKQASLCDVVAQVEQASRKLGRPLLAAPAAGAVVGPDLQPLHNLLYLAQRQNSLGAMRCAITEARLELAKVRDGQKH